MSAESPHSADETAPGFPLEGACSEGVSIESLDAGTSLTVRTCHSEYRLTVLDPARRVVLVQGGIPFPQNTRAFFQGSTTGGSAVKVGWLGVGLRMEIRTGQERISTSRVQSITIEEADGSSEVPTAA